MKFADSTLAHRPRVMGRWDIHIHTKPHLQCHQKCMNLLIWRKQIFGKRMCVVLDCPPRWPGASGKCILFSPARRKNFACIKQSTGSPLALIDRQPRPIYPTSHAISLRCQENGSIHLIYI